MKVAFCKLRSDSPYSQSRFHDTPKLNKENPRDYEERTWREKAWWDEKEEIFIPAMQFSNSIKEAAKYLGIQIEGKGKERYTKNFEAGLLVKDHLPLGIKKAEIKGEWVHVPSDGKRGGTKRVLKCFPLVFNWEGTVPYYILDDTITKEVFEKVLKSTGAFIGLGRWRPRNCGLYGRFTLEAIKWEEQ